MIKNDANRNLMEREKYTVNSAGVLSYDRREGREDVWRINKAISHPNACFGKSSDYTSDSNVIGNVMDINMT
jgi:hypothetical protein